MKINLILSVADNGVIGDNSGKLLWNLPEDLKHFRKLTLGHPVIMGSRTYASLGKPLDGRTNIVITSNVNAVYPPGVLVCHTIKETLHLIRKRDEEVFVIGGAKIAMELLPYVDYFYLTEVHIRPKGNAVFRWDKSQFKEISRNDFVPASSRDFGYSFVELQRISN